MQGFSYTLIYLKKRTVRKKYIHRLQWLKVYFFFEKYIVDVHFYLGISHKPSIYPLNVEKYSDTYFHFCSSCYWSEISLFYLFLSESSEWKMNVSMIVGWMLNDKCIAVVYVQQALIILQVIAVLLEYRRELFFKGMYHSKHPASIFGLYQ